MTLAKLHFIECRNSTLFPLIEWCEYEHFMHYSSIVLKFEKDRFLDVKQGHKDNSAFAVLRVMSSPPTDESSYRLWSHSLNAVYYKTHLHFHQFCLCVYSKQSTTISTYCEISLICPAITTDLKCRRPLIFPYH